MIWTHVHSISRAFPTTRATFAMTLEMTVKNPTWSFTNKNVLTVTLKYKLHIYSLCTATKIKNSAGLTKITQNWNRFTNNQKKFLALMRNSANPTDPAFLSWISKRDFQERSIFQLFSKFCSFRPILVY